jgi:hypothetical protein
VGTIWEVASFDTTTPVAQAKTKNDTSAATPNVVFDAARDTDNLTIASLINASNPAGVTEPSGWTEDADDGHLAPTQGIESAHRNSGETSATVTWGGSSATAWLILAIEINTSSGATVTASTTFQLSSAAARSGSLSRSADWSLSGVAARAGTLSFGSSWSLSALAARASSLARSAAYSFSATTEAIKSFLLSFDTSIAMSALAVRAGTLTRSAAYTFSAAASLAQSLALTLSATLGISALAVRLGGLIRSATYQFSAAAEVVKAFLVSVAATLGLQSSVIRATSLGRSATVSFTATVTRATTIAKSATVSFASAATLAASRTASATYSFASTVALALGGATSLTLNAVYQFLPSKAMNLPQTFAAAWSVAADAAVSRFFTAAYSVTPAVTRLTSFTREAKVFFWVSRGNSLITTLATAGYSFAADISRDFVPRVVLALNATLSFAATMTPAFFRVLTATYSFTVTAGRASVLALGTCFVLFQAELQTLTKWLRSASAGHAGLGLFSRRKLGWKRRWPLWRSRTPP